MTPADLAMDPISRAMQAIADIVKDVTAVDLVTFGYVEDGAAAFPKAFTELGPAEIVNNNATTQRIVVNLFVLVGAFSSEQAQQDLNAMVAGGDSLTVTLSKDKQLRGTVADSRVLGSDPLNLVQHASYTAWGRVWQIEILTEA